MQTPIIDAVVIGRNEGRRLLECIASLRKQVRHIIYVDSGSTDGSSEAARTMGVQVVSLDMSCPFTAARARNAGLAHITDAELVQFVDGDCTVASGWVAAASQFLSNHRNVAIVCGRRREDHPEVSIYNRLCDREWDTPVGEAKYCGGDALIRVAPLRAAEGYREDLIAGEEPELCVRLRSANWKIWRLDYEMTGHDARMTHFGQWWRRSRRAGHAFAEGAHLHGQPPECHWVAETRRALIWGAVAPIIFLGLSFGSPVTLLGFGIYPAQMLRLSRRMGTENAVFNVLGKFPESLGVLEFHLNRLLGNKRDIIEYK
ncbi:MAG: glycosyltransferase [Paracoccaceae bacterium]